MKECPFSQLKTKNTSEMEDIKSRYAAYQCLISNNFPTLNAAEGIFGPNSMHWKIYACPAVILGSYNALLLQIIHPAVAEGVSRFSKFNTDYLGRAERTITGMIKIYFGDVRTALASAAKLHHIHNRIRGTITVQKDNKEFQTNYCASDPQHLLWVQATLVQTSLIAYEKINGRLSAEEKNLFYEESKKVALLMGIPLSAYPRDYLSFLKYYKSMIAGDFLRVDATTHSLAKAIFKPPYFPAYFAKLLAAGFLPTHYRKAFKLKYGKQSRVIFNAIIAMSKFITKVIPHPFGYTPPYYQAHYRIANQEGIKPKRVDQFFNYLCGFKFFKAISL